MGYRTFWGKLSFMTTSEIKRPTFSTCERKTPPSGTPLTTSYVNGIFNTPEKTHQKYIKMAVDSLSSYFYKRLDSHYINFTLRVVT